MKRFIPCAGLALVLTLGTSQAAAQTTRAAENASDRMFGIHVIDGGTGRGVPLVELRTVSNRCFYTDSAGWIAIDDLTLSGRRTFFHVASSGYEYPADGFGFHGVAFDVKAGGRQTIKLKRDNIAERLYRITGDGIYRDSVLLGIPTPLRNPLLNAQVAGQDSCLGAVYHDQIHWFWGDTMRTSYPLGHFWTAGATSQLPGRGGLDPAAGIDLKYFVDPDGFSRPMIEHKDEHPAWLDGLIVLPDAKGGEKMIGRSTRVKSVSEVLGRSLVVYNDETEKFTKLIDIPSDSPLSLCGHPFMVEVAGTPYIYCGNSAANIRVRADLDFIQDLASYEAFTCLVPGSRYDPGDPKLDRDTNGRLVWAWKRDTAALDTQEIQELVKHDRMTEAENFFQTQDVDTNKSIQLAAGSVAYNGYRKKYVMIAVQLGGRQSMLGEMWYVEAGAPQGPWRWATKIATHEHYSFYNPVHHAFFDQNDGRTIYFQGTYSNTFSGNDRQTPLYDYNQMMYRLDLSDPRLATSEK